MKRMARAETSRPPLRTPEEQQLIDNLGKASGQPLTEQEANLAIESAYRMGDL